MPHLKQERENMTDNNNRKTSNPDAVDIHCDAFQKDLMEVLIEKSSRNRFRVACFCMPMLFLGSLRLFTKSHLHSRVRMKLWL